MSTISSVTDLTKTFVALIENQDPNLTAQLEDEFDAAIYAALPEEQEQASSELDTLYTPNFHKGLPVEDVDLSYGDLMTAFHYQFASTFG